MKSTILSRSLAMTCSSAIALSFATAPSALAQTSAGVETITVTAQKREENVQEVPISVGTLPGNEIAVITSGVDDILGLANRIPGLNVESSNGRISPRFYIRGLGNTDFDTAASQPVSLIMDEVVLENVLLKSFPIFDLEGVEVLRGPQGTLFGRNTPAGIVKFDTKKPTDEFEGFATLNYGNFNTVNSQFAVGGPIVQDVLNFRFSGLLQRQEDFIDNAFDGTEDFTGGFRELAGRLQFDYTPSDNFSALVNLQYADLNGSSSIFRANILDTGSNQLNQNFVRDLVAYDGGGGNPSFRDVFIGSIKMEADLTDSITVTSITAYSDLSRFSRGDIDGGTLLIGQPGVTPPAPFTSAPVDFFFPPDGIPDSTAFPGFIPFPSDTGGTSDSDQFTQELRFASSGAGPFQWQLGGFYFQNSLTDTTDAQLGFLGIVPVTWDSDANSWALFGQGSYDLTEDLTVTGGVRYTDDEKEFVVLTPPTATYALPNGTLEQSISDGQVSWDVSLAYAATDDINLYSRIARGFRGPSIQGRDVAFGNPTSEAQSETVISYEAGIKSILFDNTLRFNAAAYYYEVSDIQLTAVGGAGNSISLINAENADAFGFEADIEFVPTENLLLLLGFSYVDTEIKDEDLGVAPCGSGACTVLDPLNTNGFALIDGNPLPQAPDVTFNAVLRYGIPLANGELYFHTDWAVQGETNIFLYESEEYRTSGNFEGGVRVGYIFNDEKYEIAGFARNITDEENLLGGIDFNNNTGFVNQPRVYGVSLRASF